MNVIENEDGTIEVFPCQRCELTEHSHLKVRDSVDYVKVYSCINCHKLFDGDGIDTVLRSARKSRDW